MIYYLNDEFDGGRLRIFKNHTLEKDELPYFDVDPKLGNLVLFRRYPITALHSSLLFHTLIRCFIVNI
jgi:hypothetical protein